MRDWGFISVMALIVAISVTVCVAQEGVHWGETSREPMGSVAECRQIGDLMDFYCDQCSTYHRLCADCDNWACLYCEKCTSKPYDECMQWCW